MRKFVIVSAVILSSCGPPPVENIYRKQGIFPPGLNVPVAFLSIELGGKPRVLGSGWSIEGSSGILFTAKHVTEVLMGNVIELGGGECKAFLGTRVYDCSVIRHPPKRDAVILDLFGAKSSDLPKPYKMAEIRPKVGDKIFIQGFHPHPAEITKSNAQDGIKDLLVPILKLYYEARTADSTRQHEVVFDNLEGRVVKSDPESVRNSPFLNEEEKKGSLEYENDSYIKVRMVRDHKFSFGGLSGGVALNEKGEAVGIITAQDIFRIEYDKNGFLINPHSGDKIAVVRRKKQFFDTIYVTPIDSVKELYEYARQIR